MLPRPRRPSRSRRVGGAAARHSEPLRTPKIVSRGARNFFAIFSMFAIVPRRPFFAFPPMAAAGLVPGAKAVKLPATPLAVSTARRGASLKAPAFFGGLHVHVHPLDGTSWATVPGDKLLYDLARGRALPPRTRHLTSDLRRWQNDHPLDEGLYSLQPSGTYADHTVTIPGRRIPTARE